MAGKGAPKTGGRTKGTVNKKTSELMAKCEARGLDVFDLMLEYLVHPCPMEMRFNALKELCQYLYPKRKALEHSGELEPIEVIIRDYTSKK